MESTGLFYLTIINIAAFFIYALDKLKAKRAARRISERALLALALFGGSVGAWLSMQIFRHKTRHFKFKYGVPFIFIIQIAAALYASTLK